MKHFDKLTTTANQQLGGKSVLVNSVLQPKATLIWAHGAGAPMDHFVPEAFAEALESHAIKLVRFEFDYMAARRTGGAKRPPPKVALLQAEWENWLVDIQQAIEPEQKLVLGGKSMGGRIATLLNTKLLNTNGLTIKAQSPTPLWRGVICLGYPFHPPRKPDTLRVDHLQHQHRPVKILQGTRDPFGNEKEVPRYELAENVSVDWLESADHDLKPLKHSGLMQQDCIAHAAALTARFVNKL